MRNKAEVNKARGLFLRDRRKSIGKTLEDLSEEIGVTKTSVWKYEQGHPFRVENIGAIAKAYKVSEKELIDGQHYNKPQSSTVENKEKPNNQAMDYNKQQRYYELLEENYILKKEVEELRKELTGKKVPDHRAG